MKRPLRAFHNRFRGISHGVNGKIEELVKLANEQDAPGIKSKLKEIIPEYQPYQP
jgi:hypothetical protein